MKKVVVSNSQQDTTSRVRFRMLLLGVP